MVELSVGPEPLSVVIQSEVDVPSVALDDNGVPVVVVQQAAAGYGCVALDGSVLIAACRAISNSHVNRRSKF